MNARKLTQTLALAAPLFTAGLAAALPGCASDQPAPTVPGRADPYVPPRQIELADVSLRHETAFGNPVVSRDEAGNLFVTLPLRNTTNHVLAVEYRVSFLDASGQPLPGSPTTWFPINLPARAPDRITVNSVTPQAADFQIDVRYAR
jgi:hypothetical protein